MINIKIVTPCYSEALYNESQAKKSLDNLKGTLPFTFSAYTAYGTRISALRNALINDKKSQLRRGQKLEEIYTHWLFVDSDISYTADNIVQLLAHDKDIVSGAYVSKSNPDNFEAGITDSYGRNLSYVSKASTGLNKVDGYVGLGFMLVKIEALEKMEYPWFFEYTVCYTQDGVYKEPWEYSEGDNGEIAEVFAEDAGFARNARENEIDIWLDCSCIVDHNI